MNIRRLDIVYNRLGTWPRTSRYLRRGKTAKARWFTLGPLEFRWWAK